MAKLNTYCKNVKKFIIDSLFPKGFTCLACDSEIFEGELCRSCLNSLVLNNGATCPRCGRKTAKSEICIECKAALPAYERAVSPLVYEAGSADLVARFKNGRPYMAEYLSGLIVNAVNALPAVDGIVAVPMTARALNDRGYNQSELLARGVAAAIGVPFLEGAVIKVKETLDQKKLYREQRLKNLQDCFKADNAVKNKRLLVIDDVITTGATADGMARCLKKAGAVAVYVATVASVENK